MDAAGVVVCLVHILACCPPRNFPTSQLLLRFLPQIREAVAGEEAAAARATEKEAECVQLRKQLALDLDEAAERVRSARCGTP